MNPNHRRSRHRKFLIGNVLSPPTKFSQGSISFLDRLAFREKWKTDIKFGSVYVLFCISSSTILVIDIEFLELQARDTLQNICTGPISNASFVRLSISVKSSMTDKDIIIGPCVFNLVGIGPWLDKHGGPSNGNRAVCISAIVSEEENRTDPSWPAHGKVDIRNLQVRYAPHLPLVLHGLTYTFHGGLKTSIVGRTGLGMGSICHKLTSVLLATISFKINWCRSLCIALKAKEAQKKVAQADEETERLLEDMEGDGSREEK
ncbi:hypothetical protein P8452_56750 [Trifolium repens]|nr:hypothetical protein P8452_56750 [Trifolium repens]